MEPTNHHGVPPAPGVTNAQQAPAAVAHVATVGHEENLGSLLFKVDPGMAIWTWLVFGLLLVILGRFAWKPILKVLEDRENLIKNSLDGAAQARKEFEEVNARCKALLAETEKESSHLIQRAKAEAQAKADEMLAQARAESKQIVEGARLDVGREKAAALQEIRSETIQLALLAAGKVLEENMGGDAQKRTAEKFLEQVSRN